MADTFTPEQIAQILEEYFKVVGTRRYVGERYVPIFGRKGEESIEWDNSAPYEPLTIVLYQGNSYTSRQYVPIGVDITNQEFWAITGNYNAQIELYHSETIAAQNDIDTLLPKVDFSAENTVKKYIDENPTRILTFDTVADMQAATNLLAGMTCHTNGFHASGDGGAAYYKVSASGTANGMDVLALQDDLLATLVVTEPYVTPEMFGAYGDNEADDSDAVQAALNHGDIVLLNKYVCNNTMHIYGDIQGTTNSAITANYFRIHANATFTNVSFICDNSDTSVDEAISIQCSAVDCTFMGCSFDFSVANPKALAIKQSNGNLTIDGCQFNKCFINCTTDNYVKITNSNFVGDYTNENEMIHLTANSQGIISGNTFYHSLQDFIDLYSKGEGCIISDNLFDGCRWIDAVCLKVTLRNSGSSSITQGFCRRNVIANNVFRNLEAVTSQRKMYVNVITVNNDYSGVDDVNNYAGYTIITGNHFYDCVDLTDASDYVTFNAIACTCVNAVISNNVFDISEKVTQNSSYSGGVLIGSAAAFALTSHILVTNNVFKGNALGVRIDTASGVEVSNNIVDKNSSIKRFLYIVGEVDHLTVSGNIDQGSSVSISSEINSSLSDVNISNNTFCKEVSLLNASNVVISANIFEHDEYALIIDAAEEVLIANNYFKTVAKSSKSSSCYISTSANNVMINGNLSKAGHTVRAGALTPIVINNYVGGIADNSIIS